MPNIFDLIGGGGAPAGGVDNLAAFQGNPDPMGLTPALPDAMGVASGASVPVPGMNQGAMNILQALTPTPPALDPGAGAPAPAAQPAAAPDAAPAAGSPTPPRKRMSILDTIGRISDVLAKVGGAQALYQPTIDAREDRALGLADHQRGVDMDALKMAQLRGQISTAAQTADQGSAGKAIQAVQALVKNGGNAAQAWATYAKFNGVSPELTAHVQDILNADPDGSKGALDSVDSSLNGIEEYAQPAQLEVDGDGNTRLVQYGKHGDRNVIEPDDGYHFAPANAVMVDQGGKRQLIDARTGQPVGEAMTVTAHPDTIANNATRITTTRMQDASREDVARIGATSRETVAASKPGKTPAGGGAAGAAATANSMTLLDNIQRGFGKLHGMNALPGDEGGSVTGGLANALQRTIPGANQVAEQFGSAPAQTRLLMEKDINSLQSEMVKSLPASATRTKFEQEIQRRRLPDPNRMSYATGMAAISDLRGLYQQAQRELAAEQRRSPAAPAPAAAPRRILPAPAGVRPRAPVVNNW